MNARPTVETCNTCLKVHPAAPPDEECVAGEDAVLGVRHVGDAAVGVAGRGAHLQLVLAEGDLGAVAHLDVGGGAARRRDDRLGGRDEFLEKARPGDVIGVQVGVH